MKRKLLISFYLDGDKTKTKTINRVRDVATDEELRGFVNLYSSLTADVYDKAIVVDARDL